MNGVAALLDSNVVVSMLAPSHPHHPESYALLASANMARYAVAAHGYAEAFVTLTKLGGGAPFAFTPKQAWASLETIARTTILLGLTPSQLLDGIGEFVGSGGVGARVYDKLIGQVARLHGIPAIITWNTRHMAGLFPQLAVWTPTEFLQARPA